MKKFNLSLCLLLTSLSSFAASVDQHMASLYADRLVEQFDRELELPKSELNDLLHKKTHAKLIAARILLEHGEEEVKKYNPASYLEMFSNKKYQKVVSKIDLLSKDIIFPSSTRDGNVTGYAFPKDVWSLTFDDGPKSGRTQIVVDNLTRHGMKATFFMLMNQAKKNPKTAMYVVENEMEVALHSYTHLDLSKQTSATVSYEIGTAKKELEELIGKDISLFRLPYGAGTKKMSLREQIADLDLVHIFWSVDTLDWKDKNPQSIFDRTIRQMERTPKKSGIVLFHDIHSQTVVASEMVMEYLNDNQKTVCTVGAVIDYINNKTQNCL